MMEVPFAAVFLVGFLILVMLNVSLDQELDEVFHGGAFYEGPPQDCSTCKQPSPCPCDSLNICPAMFSCG